MEGEHSIEVLKVSLAGRSAGDKAIIEALNALIVQNTHTRVAVGMNIRHTAEMCDALNNCVALLEKSVLLLEKMGLASNTLQALRVSAGSARKPRDQLRQALRDIGLWAVSSKRHARMAIVSLLFMPPARWPCHLPR